MKSKDYEYQAPEEEYQIFEKRKEELIKKVKDQVRKGFIAHHQILNIGQNDEELDFLYQWLDDNDIEIRGIDSTISGEIPNYTHIPKMGQSLTPESLDDEEQEKLFWELSEFSEKDKEDGSQAYLDVRNKLIERNMKLAKWITSWKGISKIPIPLEDKYQMAYIGLANAVDKFNPSLGYKFSTYAAKAIYRRIIREAYKEDGEVKQNIVVKEQLAMIPEIEDQIFSNLGREAKPYEIADILGISLNKVRELQALRKFREKESLEQMADDRKDVETIIEDLSDGDTITESSDEAFIMDGVYIDEEDTLPEGFRMKDRVQEKIMSRKLSQSVENMLETLTEREKDVLLLRFGFVDGRTRTLEEVGQRFGLGRERIRQIENKAIRKLRHPSREKLVKDYFDGDEYERT